jgi:EpsI family protein
MTFFNNKYARIVTALLILQGIIFYSVALRAENSPAPAPLSSLPADIAGWQMYKDVKIDQETLDVLKADDTLDRIYLSPDRNANAYLFVAFFKTQRSGQAPHSPKNCLPGNGYEPIESGPIKVAIPGRAQPIEINRYLTARGEEKSVTLYWYQSHDRIIAGEYAAKFWLIADSIRYHRSDTSLVKIVVPVRDGNADAATKTAIEFVKAVFSPLALQLPT